MLLCCFSFLCSVLFCCIVALICCDVLFLCFCVVVFLNSYFLRCCVVVFCVVCVALDEDVVCVGCVVVLGSVFL